MDPQALTIYRVSRNGETKYRFLVPAQVRQLKAQGYVVKKVRVTK